MSLYDKCSLPELNKLKNRYEERRTRNIHLLRCYEAKVKRVEPLSEEFEKTMCGIFETQNQLKNTGMQLILINIAIANAENYIRDIRE